MALRRFIDPAYLAPHYSTKLFRSYYNYLAKHYSKTIFYEACDELAMPNEFLLQDNNWISHAFYLRFLDLIKTKTADSNIAEKVGLSLLTEENINPFEVAFLRLLPPFVFYSQVPNGARKVNHYSAYKTILARPGHFQYEIVSNPSLPHDPDTCRNAIGVLSAPKEFLGLNKLNVTEPLCIHRGDQRCVIDVRYSAWRFYLDRLWSILIFGLGGLAAFKAAPLLSLDTMTMSYLLLAIASLLIILIHISLKVRGIIRHHNLFYEQSKAKEQVLYESKLLLDRRYREAYIQRDLSLNLVSKNSAKDVIKSCVDELLRQFGYERIMVMLLNSKQGELRTEEVRGFDAHKELLFKLALPFPATKDGPQLFSNILSQGKTELIADMDEYRKNLQPMNQLLLSALDVKNLIVTPIKDSESNYGVLIVGATGADRHLNNDDKHLLENVSRMLAIYFKQANSFERERTLKSVFEKYVPSVVMDNIRNLEGGKSTGLTMPQSNAITSMFIDLRGFTKISESLNPDRVVEMLNIYFDYATEIIAQYGGIIDNLIGDGIVAFFPATKEHRTLHAKQAVICSIEILAKASELNVRLKQSGFQAVTLGIGLHSGLATVGNVGGKLRVNYTAIGDTVNVAARLEGMCKTLTEKLGDSSDGIIVLSEAVLRRAPLQDPPLPAGSVVIRGRAEPLQVYVILQTLAEQLAAKDSNDLFSPVREDPRIVIDPVNDERRGA